MIGQQERSMVAGAPPLRSSTDFQCHVPIAELEAHFPQIHIVVVEVSLRSCRRATSEGFRIADKLWLDHDGRPISHLQPPTHVSLVLHAIRIIFTITVFAETDRLPAAD